MTHLELATAIADLQAIARDALSLEQALIDMRIAAMELEFIWWDGA